MNRLLEFSTNKKLELVNITKEVGKVIGESTIDEGICVVFTPHSTTAILINEDEAGFRSDIEVLINQWVPQGDWQHNKVDNNATSHIASSLIGQSKTIPIRAGGLQLGNWQEIFLVELDGPRSRRRVIVQTVEDN